MARYLSRKRFKAPAMPLCPPSHPRTISFGPSSAVPNLTGRVPARTLVRLPGLEACQPSPEPQGSSVVPPVGCRTRTDTASFEVYAARAVSIRRATERPNRRRAYGRRSKQHPVHSLCLRCAEPWLPFVVSAFSNALMPPRDRVGCKPGVPSHGHLLSPVARRGSGWKEVRTGHVDRPIHTRTLVCTLALALVLTRAPTNILCYPPSYATLRFPYYWPRRPQATGCKAVGATAPCHYPPPAVVPTDRPLGQARGRTL
ncbi:hypothetical protein C8Q77DRAFT_1092526 [Trametes polyzona]|nr:hypothetical protein C8Q77DRAFT_1092526 [Trametes polyzona]